MILNSLKTYWAGNTTLQAALPITKVFLDLVPEKTAFPYARLTVLGASPDYLTGGTKIQTFSYQLSIYHTDLDALSAINDSIQANLNRAYPTTATMSHSITNEIETCEITNGVYTYGVTLEYEWTYNSVSA